jgi:hypothetical protein
VVLGSQRLLGPVLSGCGHPADRRREEGRKGGRKPEAQPILCLQGCVRGSGREGGDG